MKDRVSEYGITEQGFYGHISNFFFIGLFEGENIGKMLVKIGTEAAVAI